MRPTLEVSVTAAGAVLAAAVAAMGPTLGLLAFRAMCRVIEPAPAERGAIGLTSLGLALVVIVAGFGVAVPCVTRLMKLLGIEP